MKLRKSIVLGAHEDPRIDLTRTDMERRLEKITQLQQRAERSPNMFDEHSASEGEDSQTPVKRRVLRQQSRSNHEVAVCRFESGTESDESVGGDGGGGGGISGSGSGHERMEIDSGSENSQPLSQGTAVALHPAQQMKSPPTKMKMKFKGQQRRQNRKSLRRGSASHNSPFEVVEEYLELGPGRVRKRNAGTRDPRYLLRCGNYGSVEAIAIEMYTIGSDQQHAKMGGGAGGGIVTVGAANGPAATDFARQVTVKWGSATEARVMGAGAKSRCTPLKLAAATSSGDVDMAEDRSVELWEIGLHAENKPIRLLFWLLLHREVFAPLESIALAHIACVEAPLDFSTANFYAHRAVRLEARLDEIARMTPHAVRDEVVKGWETLRGCTLASLGGSSVWSKEADDERDVEGSAEDNRWGGKAHATNPNREQMTDIAYCLGGARVAKLCVTFLHVHRRYFYFSIIYTYP